MTVTDVEAAKDTNEVAVNAESYRFTDLKPGRLYEFRVRQCFDYLGMTKCSEPNQPVTKVKMLNKGG